MEMPSKQLQFAVRFAQSDLQTFRPGDWLNLRDDVIGFFGWTPLGTLGASMAWPRSEFEPAALRELQHHLRAMLEPWAGEPGEVRQSGGSGIPVQVTLKRRQVRGRLRDVFLLEVHLLLAIHGADRVRRCRECGSLFYKVGRMTQCQRRCTNRRAWAAKVRRDGRARVDGGRKRATRRRS